MDNTQEVEMLAMEMWENETGNTYGWGSVPETYEYREKAMNLLKEKREHP